MMPALSYINNQLHLDGIAIEKIIKQYGTPCYVYSLKTIQQQLHTLQQAFSAIETRFFYAVKANNNLAILNQFVQADVGFDVVSSGELKRVLHAKAKAESVIFSGVGKRPDELNDAIMNHIHCINIESIQELKNVAALAKQQQHQVNIAIRINPNVDAHTHHAISTGLSQNKFGILVEELPHLLPLLKQPFINCIGIACHIGSQITEVMPYVNAAKKMCSIAETFLQQQIKLTHIDLGGGFGIAYDNEPLVDINAIAAAIIPIIKPLSLHLYLEPGRFLIGPAACLVTEVLYTKQHGEDAFAIIDAGMNDFMRPALYGAIHQLHPVQLKNSDKKPYHIVGPVCESTDCFARAYPIALAPHDYLVFDSVGAYGASMASRYNARPLIPEVLIANNKPYLIRQRETIEETYRLEHMPVELQSSK